MKLNKKYIVFLIALVIASGFYAFNVSRAATCDATTQSQFDSSTPGSTCGKCINVGTRNFECGGACASLGDVCHPSDTVNADQCIPAVDVGVTCPAGGTCDAASSGKCNYDTGKCATNQRCVSATVGSTQVYRCAEDSACGTVQGTACTVTFLNKCGQFEAGNTCANGRERCQDSNIPLHYVCKTDATCNCKTGSAGCPSDRPDCADDGTCYNANADVNSRPNGTACSAANQCVSNYCSPAGVCSCAPNGTTVSGAGAGATCCTGLAGDIGGGVFACKAPPGCKADDADCSAVGSTCCGSNTGPSSCVFTDPLLPIKRCKPDAAPVAQCIHSGSCTPSGSQAQCCNGFSCSGGQCSPIPISTTSFDFKKIDLGGLIGIFYSLSIPIGILLGAFFIIRAGYMLKMSEGNPQKVKEAQEALTAAIIGTLFVLLSAVILRVIIIAILGVAPGF